MRFSPLYSTYGAQELKATYQLNMLKSNGLVFSAFMLVILSFWISSLLAPPTIVIPETKRVIADPWEIPPPPKIVPEYPAFANEQRRVEPLVVGIPTPIPDEEATDDNMVIPDRDEMRRLVDDSYNNLLSDSGVNYSFNIDSLLDDDIPDPEKFKLVDRMPEMINHQQPEYPRMAKKMGLAGVVYIQALVETDGSVMKANVKRTSGSALLDESAMRAAYKNKYSPALLNSEPVRIWVVYKVVFELD